MYLASFTEHNFPTRPTHVVAEVGISSFFVAKQYSTEWRDHICLPTIH